MQQYMLDIKDFCSWGNFEHIAWPTNVWHISSVIVTGQGVKNITMVS